MRSDVAPLFLLPFLLLLAMAAKAADMGVERTFFIAADEVAWDYAPSGGDNASGLLFNESSAAGEMVIMGEEPPSTWVLPGPQRYAV